MDWLSAADYAISNGVPLWCDDVLLAQVARSEGAKVFNTIDVLNHRLATGALAPELADSALAALIVTRHVDLGFRAGPLTLALGQDAWKPTGAALAISRPAAWGDPERVVTFVMTALRQVAASDAEAVRGWVEAASLGLGRIGGDVTAISTNVAIFLQALIKEAWLGPSQMPFVVLGIRAALAGQDGVGDPLEEAIAGHYAWAARQSSHELAATTLIWLFAQCEERDRATVARVILRAR